MELVKSTDLNCRFGQLHFRPIIFLQLRPAHYFPYFVSGKKYSVCLDLIRHSIAQRVSIFCSPNDVGLEGVLKILQLLFSSMRQFRHSDKKKAAFDSNQEKY